MEIYTETFWIFVHVAAPTSTNLCDCILSYKTSFYHKTEEKKVGEITKNVRVTVLNLAKMGHSTETWDTSEERLCMLQRRGVLQHLLHTCWAHCLYIVFKTIQHEYLQAFWHAEKKRLLASPYLYVQSTRIPAWSLRNAERIFMKLPGEFTNIHRTPASVENGEKRQIYTKRCVCIWAQLRRNSISVEEKKIIRHRRVKWGMHFMSITSFS